MAAGNTSYTLYAFIENQDYTLADVPRFLTDRAFREHIVANIRYNRPAADFWRGRCESKRAAAALTRVDALLGDPYVHDIVAQRETTIDFTKFIEEQRIVLIKLSDRLSTDVKTFIGTILISELVDAVKRCSTENPHQVQFYKNLYAFIGRITENIMNKGAGEDRFMIDDFDEIFQDFPDVFRKVVRECMDQKKGGTLPSAGL